MSIDQLKNSIPDYAKDIKLNLSSIVRDTTLSEQQLWGTMLASALATKNSQVIACVSAEAVAHLSEQAQNAAKAAASIMAMNNVYYKFVGMIGGDYKTMPAGLRMNVIANPGVEKVDFELWSMAVSAMNGCQFCVQAHEQAVMKDGVSKEQIQTSVRIAAIIQAVAATLAGEAGLAAAGNDINAQIAA